MIRVTDNISIDETEIEEVFSRAGGPGGQHVNKVSTAVQLRFDINASTLPAWVKQRLTRLAGNRVTQEGVLIIESRESRRREQNRANALEKLLELIRQAAERPKKRIKTRPSKASKEKRLESKKGRTRTKLGRKKVRGED